jgi:hypothetical protein
MKIQGKCYLKTITLFLFYFFPSENAFSQCNVTSSNGWTATFNVTPTAVIPSTTNCQWSYNYDIRFDLKVTFSGSTTGRSVSGNLYFNCTGGSGGQPYRSLGTFTANTNSANLATTNNARSYSAVSSYNYGSNPSCTTIKLSDVNCSSYRIDYWGTGVTNGSTTCPSSVPLPIELMYFDANNSGNIIHFRWATASELNNDYFTLERSLNNEYYQPIIVIQGAGTSNIAHYYTVMDANPPSGKAYYRLKQTDFDGHFTYSQVFVAENLTDKNELTLQPNPVKNKILISTARVINGLAAIKIIDVFGKKVADEILSLPENALPELSVSNLPKGIYFLILTDANHNIQTGKFIKE